jgi:hypothetical protein
VVSVFANAKVTTDVLESAKAEATAIFSSMGIELVWRAQSPARDVDLTIRVIDRPIKGASKSAMGLAVPDQTGSESFLFAFLNRVEEFARHHDRPVAQMLGHVIAHEMGHLLLPTVAHSNSGIMVAGWEGAQIAQFGRGGLSFTPKQAEDIRRKVGTFARRR